MNPKVFNLKNIHMFCSVVGSFLIIFSLGGAYSYGDLNVYLNNSALVYKIGMFGLSSSMGFGGYLAHRIGPQITVFIGTLIMNAGVMLTEVAGSLSCLTYGLLCGVGAGLSFSVCFEITCQWFHKYLGSILGVILSGFSLGPILVHYLIDNVFSKDESNPNEVFRYLGIIFLTTQFVGLLLLQKVKDDQNEENQHLFSINIVQEIPTHNMILEIDFWIIWLILALNSFGSIFLMQFYPPSYIPFFRNLSTVYTDHIFQFSGRIIWGCLSDYFSMKTVFCTMSLGSCFVYAMHILLSSKDDVLKIMTSVMYIWISGNSSIIFGLVIKRFGKQHFATNLGCIMTAYCMSGIIASCLNKYMITSNVITFSIIDTMSFLTFMLTLFYNGQPRRYLVNIADIFSFLRYGIL